MQLPDDILNIITDYYVSMVMYDIRQKVHTEFKKNNVVRHIKSFHDTTLSDGDFCPKFCLAVVNYMNKHRMFI